MVFFTCNACGESLKKAQVDKHVSMCRGCQVLSCIDCGKDFWGDDYKNHLKCISEDQKYGGKGYEAKTNKGDVKQHQWIQRIQEAMNKPGINAKLKDVLNQVSSYDNVPRKKAKFQNWMKNSLKIHNPTLHDQVWDIFSAATSNAPEKSSTPQQSEPKPPANEMTTETNGTAHPQNNSEEEAPVKEKKKNKRERKEERQKKNKRKRGAEDGDERQPQNGDGDASEKPEKKKNKRRRRGDEDEGGEQNGHSTEEKTSKRKQSKQDDLDDSHTAEEEPQGDGEGQLNTKGKFNWKGTIKAILKDSPEEGLAVKRLKKKVLAAYYSFSGDGNYKSEEELFSLFNKKVNNNPKFRVLKDKVRLVK